MTIVAHTWLVLYADAIAFSVWLYIHNHRYNAPSSSKGNSPAEGRTTPAT